VLEPFSDVVDERFRDWLEAKAKGGRKFTEEQVQWLTEIKSHIASSLNIEVDDFDDVPFSKHGGRVKAIQVFGDELPKVFKRVE